MKKTEFIKSSLIIILEDSKDWIDIRDLTYRISQRNGSYRITVNAVARISTTIPKIQRRKVYSNSTSVTQYRISTDSQVNF